MVLPYTEYSFNYLICLETTFLILLMVLTTDIVNRPNVSYGRSEFSPVPRNLYRPNKQSNIDRPILSSYTMAWYDGIMLLNPTRGLFREELSPKTLILVLRETESGASLGIGTAVGKFHLCN